MRFVEPKVTLCVQKEMIGQSLLFSHLLLRWHIKRDTSQIYFEIKSILETVKWDSCFDLVSFCLLDLEHKGSSHLLPMSWPITLALRMFMWVTMKMIIIKVAFMCLFRVQVHRQDVSEQTEHFTEINRFTNRDRHGAHQTRYGAFCVNTFDW